jgi:hypothetical protein
MRRRNAGQVRIIEAFLAVFVVFSAFTITTNFTPSTNNKKQIDLTSTGLQTLTSLDADGTLNNTIPSGNWTALREALDLTLPNSVSFNATIRYQNMTQVNSEQVSNGGFGTQTSSVEYVFVAQTPVFQCYLIQLRLGVAG